MQLFKASDIDWDCDDDVDSAEKRRECADALNLPSTVYVHAEDADAVTEVLSDEFGFCIKALNVEEVTDALTFVVG